VLGLLGTLKAYARYRPPAAHRLDAISFRPASRPDRRLCDLL